MAQSLPRGAMQISGRLSGGSGASERPGGQPAGDFPLPRPLPLPGYRAARSQSSGSAGVRARRARCRSPGSAGVARARSVPSATHRSLRSPSSHGLSSRLGTSEAQDRREGSVGSLSWPRPARGSLSRSQRARPHGKSVMGEKRDPRVLGEVGVLPPDTSHNSWLSFSPAGLPSGVRTWPPTV